METVIRQERVNGPFVNTPAGRGIVEVGAGRDLYVRLDDGRRDWFEADECEPTETPAGYQPPDPRDIPGYIR